MAFKTMADNIKKASAIPTEADLQALRSSAENGDAEAQFKLGLNYEYARGVPQDSAEALKRYRMSSEHGDKFGIVYRHLR